jgi:hypothetical protein
VEEKAGTVTALSIMTALASLILSFVGHPGWGFLLALTSIPLGAIGIAMAASMPWQEEAEGKNPIAIILGLIAIGVAVFVLLAQSSILGPLLREVF